MPTHAVSRFGKTGTAAGRAEGLVVAAYHRRGPACLSSPGRGQGPGAGDHPVPIALLNFDPLAERDEKRGAARRVAVVEVARSREARGLCHGDCCGAVFVEGAAAGRAFEIG